MVVYKLSPTTKFLCMQVDEQTDGQGETDNQYTPTPIPRGKRYTHSWKCYFVLVLLKVHFLKKKNYSWAIFVLQ